MGKPYWGYYNRIIADSPTLATLSESSVYPATNLQKHRLWPGYRSAQKYLTLNGTDERAHVTHADFDITGDLSIEFLISPASIAAGTAYIVWKQLAGDGYLIYRSAANLGVQINDTTGTGNTGTIITTAAFFVASTWVRGKVVYDASAQEVKIYKNGALVATANNSSPSGCTVTGTIPTAIGSTASSFNIGANAAGSAGFFGGSISYVAVSAEEHDTACNYIERAGTNNKGYWEFDDDLTDSSGNSHTLTGVGIDSSNYSSGTPREVISATFTSTTDPVLLFIPRQHNLSTNATVKLFRGNWISASTASEQNGSTFTVTADQPVLIRLSAAPTTDTGWWIEISDPSNSDGYIEIPYIFLGDYTSMERAHLKGYSHGDIVHGAVVADSCGGYTGYVRSEPLWTCTYSFNLNANDYATVQSVIGQTRYMRPVVFCNDIDSETTETYLVYLPGSQDQQYQHTITTRHMVSLQLNEAGGGAS